MPGCQVGVACLVGGTSWSLAVWQVSYATACGCQRHRLPALARVSGLLELPEYSAHLHIVAGVEGLQVKLAVGLGGPQAQVDGVVGAKAGDGVVIGHRRHRLTRVPAEHLAPLLIVHCTHGRAG